MTLLPVNLTVGRWQHMCVSWNRRAGVWHAYLGGKLKSEGSDLATRHTVRPGGTLILGQEQVRKTLVSGCQISGVKMASIHSHSMQIPTVF